MGDAAAEFFVPLLGALQAAVSVLLIIFSGVLAGQFGWLSDGSSREISKMCVNMFLPALLINDVGSQMHLGTAMSYVPVIIWAIAYNAVSMVLGLTITKLFKLPDWVTPAIAFNNTTSLPLLLVQSLEATGILEAITSSDDAVARAKAFFLMNAMVGNSLTFTLGPRLLHGHSEDAPDPDDETKNGPDETEDNHEIESQEHQAEEANEQTSLLPNGIIQPITRMDYDIYKRCRKAYRRLPRWAQMTLDFLSSFANPPLIGAAIGVLIGLVPALHRLFFSTQEHGGYLNAWLTSAIKNIGNLFAALQAVVVGVKLSNSVVKMKRGEASGDVPWFATTLVLVIRFVIWPAVSIGVIYALATKTDALFDDPLLWFCMMLMPAGPPALKLTALADVNGAPEEERMTISKFLIISYAVSPVICFAVVGSMKAAQAAI